MKLYFYNGQPTQYAVTEDGQVFSYKTNKWMKGSVNKNGYVTVVIRLDNHVIKRLYVHRMVMETFNPNPNSHELEVNHINANKSDNRLENLEWCTHQQNLQHSIDNNLRSHQPIYAFDDNKRLCAQWVSLAELQRCTGWQIGNISKNCKEDYRVKIHGYYWNYSSNSDFEIYTPSSGVAKPVGQFDLNSNLIATYPSRSAAAKALNCVGSHISEACNGKLKTYKGFIWKYLIDDIVCSSEKSEAAKAGED